MRSVRGVIAGLTAALAIVCSVSAQPASTPDDVPAGPAGVDPPGSTAPPLLTLAEGDDAPVISAISETTYPGETLVITGDRLAQAHLRVWTEGATFDITPLRSAADRMQAVVPTQVTVGGQMFAVSRSTMLVWPVRDDLIGRPIRVNAATAWWVWPCRVATNQTDRALRIFGKNLASPVRPPVAVLQSESGPARTLELLGATDYDIELRLPDDLPPGRYQVWAHNGAGGAYGWSEPVCFQVVPPPRPTPRVYFVDDYLAGANNAADAVLAAVQDAQRNGGGVIRFAARHYLLNKPVILPADVPVTLRGAGKGGWNESRNVPTGNGTVLQTYFAIAGNVAIELRGPGSSIQDLTLIYTGADHVAGIRLAGPDQSVRNVTVVCATPRRISACIESHFRGQANHQILNCSLYMFNHCVRVTDGTDFVRIADCKLRGHFSIGRGTLADAVVNWGGNEMILENCDVQSEDRDHGKIVGRTCLLYKSSIRHCYLANNRSVSVGPHSSVPGIESNVGEQYLFHSRGEEGGIFPIASAEPDRLTVAGANLPADIDGSGDWIVFIARGRGVGQWRTVSRRLDGATLLLHKPFRVNPQTDGVAIIQQAFRHNIVYDNFIDPAPNPNLIESNMKTVGVYFFHNAFDNITANNTIQHAGVGVAIATNPDTPSAWNVIRENRFRQIAGFAGGTAQLPMFYGEHSRGVLPPSRKELHHWVSVGNVFRSNEGAGAPAAVQIGWLRGAEQWDQDFDANADAGLVMSVVENNVFSQVDQPLLLTAPANWTLWRNNTLDADAVTGDHRSPTAGAKVIAPRIEP